MTSGREQGQAISQGRLSNKLFGEAPITSVKPQTMNKPMLLVKQHCSINSNVFIVDNFNVTVQFFLDYIFFSKSVASLPQKFPFC